jgi:hypothetical protein
LIYLPPGHANGLEQEGRSESQAGSSSSFQLVSFEGIALCTLGKRRREREPEKEAVRRKKRQKTTPRLRRRTKNERVARSKRRQATGQVVQSHITYDKLLESRKVDQSPAVYDIEAVRSKNVIVVPWDGVWVRRGKESDERLIVPTSTPTPILAKNGELFALLAGRPLDPSYSKSLSELEGAMLAAKDQFTFNGKLGKNRRGSYRAISTGVTHGTGSKVSLAQLVDK